jgi:dTDP-4-amino-4,6-dideoxygalactose transaminase
MQKCYESLGYRPGDLPESEKAAAEVLALPIYPGLTEDAIDYVCGKIQEFYCV